MNTPVRHARNTVLGHAPRVGGRPFEPISSNVHQAVVGASHAGHGLSSAESIRRPDGPRPRDLSKASADGQMPQPFAEQQQAEDQQGHCKHPHHDPIGLPVQEGAGSSRQ